MGKVILCRHSHPSATPTTYMNNNWMEEDPRKPIGCILIAQGGYTIYYQAMPFLLLLLPSLYLPPDVSPEERPLRAVRHVQREGVLNSVR